ncbi:MAG: FkbM family methyltransferase [Saprospiraceae bacterium]|nr:FkbM family methyltransferase [Saprospiraceae bacterium]
MSALIQTIRFLFSHPLARRSRWAALRRFVTWQIASRVLPHPVIHPFVGTTRLIVEKGMTGATGNIYTGLHEFEDMAFLLHFLRPEDLFADIGANIGSYTVLAGGVANCRVFSAEPVPATFNHLQDNVLINHLSEKVQLCNAGIGAETGRLSFTRSLDTTNHVAVAGEKDTIEVPVTLLDEAIGETPRLIKIDVEGFEMAVLQGAKRILSDTHLKALIVEINQSCIRYGHTPEEVHGLLVGYGFTSYQYEPFGRALTPTDGPGEQNTIYLRDPGFATQRVRNAEKVQVLGQQF